MTSHQERVDPPPHPRVRARRTSRWLPLALGLSASALVAGGILGLCPSRIPTDGPALLAAGDAPTREPVQATTAASDPARRPAVERDAAPPASPLTIPSTLARPSPSQADGPPSDLPASRGMTRYVATMGSDTATGTIEAPLRTVQLAVDLSAAGDTVVVRAGTFDGFDVSAHGGQGAPVTVRAYGGEDPIIEGSSGRSDVIHVTPEARNVVLEGLTVQGSTAYRGSGVLIENNLEGPIVIRRCRLRGNAGFGINVYQSRNVVVDQNDISDNGTGVQIIGQGADVTVTANDVHENDRMIRNTPRSFNDNDDYGAVGIALVRSVGPAIVSGNRVWANRARSYDYEWDGGAFEIFGASNVTIRDNTVWDNEDVLETGTDGVVPCAGNRFIRNLAYGHTTVGRSRGIILRCGKDMLIAYNTLADLQDYALEVGEGSPVFSGPIAGAQVVDNVLTLSGAGTPYRFERPRPAGLLIDWNLIWTTGRTLAYVAGHGATSKLSQLSAWTGYERNGVSADPRFVASMVADYRLRADSPAVDMGVSVSGVSDGYAGRAPDLGVFERP